MDIIISGITGRMGRILAEAADRGGVRVAGGIGRSAKAEEGSFPEVSSYAQADMPADVIIDFSNHENTAELLELAKRRALPLVIATTGQTEEELSLIKEASSVLPIFFSANYSMGIALLTELAKKAASALPDAELEIVETHHDRKLDAPSGTALSIGRALCSVRPDAELLCGRSGLSPRKKNEIGISSIRIGNYAGEHEVIIGTQSETLRISHSAHSREVFADGALAAAAFIIGKPAGLYTMEDMLRL